MISKLYTSIPQDNIYIEYFIIYIYQCCVSILFNMSNVASVLYFHHLYIKHVLLLLDSQTSGIYNVYICICVRS